MPALALPLALLMIPNVKLEDDFITEEDAEYRRSGLLVRGHVTENTGAGEHDEVHEESDDEYQGNRTQTDHPRADSALQKQLKSEMTKCFCK